MIDITLTGVHNARDLGGTRTRDGRIIRPGCLIRSAHLGQATPRDVEILRREHRLDTVIDLRTEQEIVERPDRLYGLNYLHFSIIEALMHGVTHEQAAGEPETYPDMADLYRAMMLDRCGIENFHDALEAIFGFDYDRGAVLWHCTEGKDRCGMTAALVLEALGVDRDAILEDYLLTNRVNLPKAQKKYEQALPVKGKAFAESVYHAYLAEQRYIEAAWDAMGEDYLTATLGFTQDRIEAFREKVLA
ncbi:MAG: tyrosine-protein phosphatase [Clostridiales bacterium]|nr:tyrosine-protein phosphatase [Clostridiales bacterium]